MPVATATAILGGAALAGTIGSGLLGASAAKSAASAQKGAADAGIAEQRRQFDEVKKLLAPFINEGTGALGEMGNLIGLSGNVAQDRSIGRLESSSEYQSLVGAGENAILQNASATGGLRGGNTQDALMRFRPEVLSQLINQQYGRLQGIAGMGQSSAAFQGNAGMQTGQNVAGLLEQRGAAQAGGTLGQAQAYGGMISGLTQGAGIAGRLIGAF
jgi:hypothetical protein